jgi:beta-methylarginine biosynthesis bifunctional aminotransferase
LQQLAEYCSAKKICLVVDQVYDSFFEVGCPPISPLIAAADWRYLFAVNSLSKNYGAPGLRTGWVISASQNITKLGATLERECVAVAGPSQEAAALLLRRGNQALIQAVKRRKQIIAQHLACLPMIRYCVPEGGVQFYAKLPVDDIEAFADFAMLKFRLILTTAGNFAGATGPYIRIPFCEDQTTLIRALKLLSQALHAWIKHPPRWS